MDDQCVHKYNIDIYIYTETYATLCELQKIFFYGGT